MSYFPLKNEKTRKSCFGKHFYLLGLTNPISGKESWPGCSLGTVFDGIPSISTITKQPPPSQEARVLQSPQVPMQNSHGTAGWESGPLGKNKELPKPTNPAERELISFSLM